MEVGNEAMFATLGERLAKGIQAEEQQLLCTGRAQCWAEAVKLTVGLCIVCPGGRVSSQHMKTPGGWPESWRLRVRGCFKAEKSHVSTIWG